MDEFDSPIGATLLFVCLIRAYSTVHDIGVVKRMVMPTLPIRFKTELQLRNVNIYLEIFSRRISTRNNGSIVSLDKVR